MQHEDYSMFFEPAAMEINDFRILNTLVKKSF